MDKRLKLIASYIDDGVGFADIGTDHGILPAAMAKCGYVGNIIASDINAAPLQTAVETAQLEGVEGRISFLLCDGLSLCDPNSIDTIVIAGMGGDMICRILDEGYWCMNKRYKLILQPMSKAEVLRYWLVYNGFDIEAEELCDDSNTVYQIIVARFGGSVKLSDAELFTGKAELCRNKKLLKRRVTRLCEVFADTVQGMENAESTHKKIGLPLCRSILSEFEEMRERYADC